MEVVDRFPLERQKRPLDHRIDQIRLLLFKAEVLFEAVKHVGHDDLHLGDGDLDEVAEGGVQKNLLSQVVQLHLVLGRGAHLLGQLAHEATFVVQGQLLDVIAATVLNRNVAKDSLREIQSLVDKNLETVKRLSRGSIVELLASESIIVTANRVLRPSVLQRELAKRKHAREESLTVFARVEVEEDFNIILKHEVQVDHFAIVNDSDNLEVGEGHLLARSVCHCVDFVKVLLVKLNAGGGQGDAIDKRANLELVADVGRLVALGPVQKVDLRRDVDRLLQLLDHLESALEMGFAIALELVDEGRQVRLAERETLDFLVLLDEGEVVWLH